MERNKSKEKTKKDRKNKERWTDSKRCRKRLKNR
jgi:hypothetical protein